MVIERVIRCEDCGRELTVYSGNQTRCPECQKEHAKMMKRRWKRNRRGYTNLMPEKNHGLLCGHRDCIYADKLTMGIDYCNFIGYEGRPRGEEANSRCKYYRT